MGPIPSNLLVYVYISIYPIHLFLSCDHSLFEWFRLKSASIFGVSTLVGMIYPKESNTFVVRVPSYPSETSSQSSHRLVSTVPPWYWLIL